MCVCVLWCVLFSFWNRSRLEFLHLCADLFYKWRILSYDCGVAHSLDKWPHLICIHPSIEYLLSESVSHFSCVHLFVTSWIVALQAPLSIGILQARILEWVAMPSSKGSSWPGDQTPVFCVFCIAGRFFTHWAIREAIILYINCQKILLEILKYREG